MFLSPSLIFALFSFGRFSDTHPRGTIATFGAQIVSQSTICGYHFGDFCGPGEIVKIVLFLERELNSEGWREAEVPQFTSFFCGPLPESLQSSTFGDFGVLWMPIGSYFASIWPHFATPILQPVYGTISVCQSEPKRKGSAAWAEPLKAKA